MTVGKGKPSASSKKADAEIRKFCLSFPESKEDRPWGHAAYKVKNKTFVFSGVDEGGFGLSVKLTESHEAALDLKFCEPTHYGLGKHGWVSASFGPKDKVPVDLLKVWIRESFRNVAPKAVLKKLDAGAAAKPAPARKTKKKQVRRA